MDHPGKKAAVTYRDAEGKRATVRGHLRGLADGAVVLDVDTVRVTTVPTQAAPELAPAAVRVNAGGEVFLVEPKSLAPEKKEKLADNRVDFRIR